MLSCWRREKARSDREENENEHAKLYYISVLPVL